MAERSLECSLVWLLLSLVTFLPPPPAYGLTRQQQNKIVAAHNKYRSETAATNMMKMSWDTDLERIAKEYAPQCVWAHNPGRGRTGENLYATTDKLSVEEGVRAWEREERYYNYDSLTCEKNKMCGHYTQVVWAASDKVGCADQFCETMSGLTYKKLSLLVCNYLPPGNLMNHKPYKKGTPCSECPSGFTCHRNLCTIAKKGSKGNKGKEGNKKGNKEQKKQENNEIEASIIEEGVHYTTAQAQKSHDVTIKIINGNGSYYTSASGKKAPLSGSVMTLILLAVLNSA